MPSTRRVLLMATLSGLLSYILLWVAGNLPRAWPLPSEIFTYAPGLLFGLLVLQMGSPSTLRRVLITICCGLIWYLMYQLATSLVADAGKPTLFACGVAGGVGAWLVSLVVRLLKPKRLSLLAMLMAFVTGTLGGLLIGQGVLDHELTLAAQLLMVTGFVAWQVGVGGCMLLVDELGVDEYHA